MKKASLALSAFLAVPSLPAADYSAVGPKLGRVVLEEMREWGLGGISVALVEDQEVVYAAGFGEAKRDSVFRVGSISKLFNAVAVMQQVEAGALNLDAPLPPELAPVNPFPEAPAVTLRQILCHRSGLPREAPVGGYLDGSQPSLAATVASAHACVLATRPGEKTRYSNLAPSMAGRMVEQVTRQSFEDYQQARVLGPLGMTNSAWTLDRVSRRHLIVSHMRVADGRGGWTRRQAPVFDLGTIPAGNLFSSVDDLARFASALLAGGGPLVKPATLAEMWRPQLTAETNGFGLGFMVGKFRGHRAVSHNGAVYGHSTSLVLLPEAKLAAIVLGNEDIVNGRIQRISQAALSLLVEAKLGEKAPAAAETPAPADLAAFAGEYESQSYWAKLEVRQGRLAGDLSGQPTKFSPAGDLKFTADSRIESATPVTFTRDKAGKISGFTMGIQRFQRVPANPAPLPHSWQAVVGSYGPSFIPLVVSERHGHLYVMTENMVDYRLTPINRHACGLPPGMYVDEQMVFLATTKGRVKAVDFANMVFPRR